jgi:GTP-binding protein
MSFTSASFVMSASVWNGGPAPDRPEVALLGRSNVGKSSLLNRLVGHRSLAKVSATPGKTRLLNYFSVAEPKPWYLVDLPGYGFAKRSKTEREGYAQLIWGYLSKRETLFNLLLLIDSRLEPQALDLAMIEQLAEAGVPFTLVFTKADKLSTSQLRQSVDRFMAVLAPNWEELPQHVVTSASSGLGIDSLRAFLTEHLSKH